MGDLRGFLKVAKGHTQYRPVCERVRDYREVAILRPDERSMEQGSRCMDCGTPFCHWGCPIGNYIPEWNDHMFRGRWEKAIELLDMTNNLPEITGRVCPAPCEYACILGINDEPVTIRENELAIIEHAFRTGAIKPRPPKRRTKKSVAVIGSGPAGLSCAAQLNRAGHNVVLFEKDKKAGGILRYGIPDFKLDKSVIDRRIHLLTKEGIKFATGIEVGADFSISKLKSEFDAVCLTGGSRVPRDLKVEGRELAGIYFAMDYLSQSNRRIAGEHIPESEAIDARGKKVVVIGGGDTGADCVGTANRQGALCVVQIEVLPKPSVDRPENFPWPKYPPILKTTSSHEEGAQRHWLVQTKKFAGEAGRVKKLVCTKDGKEFEIEADLVILAVGFLHPRHEGLLQELGVAFDDRGNVKTGPDYQTSVKTVFSAGDMRRGQSLIVWAISEGRRAAHSIDEYLMGKSLLPYL